VILNKVKLSPFGGVKDKQMEFTPGLNVILGPNEAGKSTLVNAIFSVLFLESTLRKSTKEWKEFLVKFMPYPHGDTIEVTLNFKCSQGNEYCLVRSWGEEKKDRLILQDGSEVNRLEKIQELLAPVLRYGRGTFEGVLMARQEEMIKTLEMLKKNSEAAHTLSGILRSVIFQSGGVSVEDLGSMIAEEKKSLLSNWDVDRNAPRGDRGIDNPHKKNVGKVLSSYYRVEELKRQLRAGQELEKRVEEITLKLKELNREKTEKVEPLKTKYEKIEGDIQRRSALEPRLDLIKQKEKRLKEVNSQWPQIEEKIKNLQARGKEKEKQKEVLQKEKAQAKEVIASRQKRELHNRVKPLVEQIEREQEKLQELPEVTTFHVKTLENTANKISRLKATLEAMKLKGNIRSRQPLEVKITSGLDSSKILKVDPESVFEAEGRVVLEGPHWTLEIQSGQQDVKKIMREVEEAQGSYRNKLKELSVQEAKEARDILEKRAGLEESIKHRGSKVEASLGEGLTFKELEKQVGAMGEDRPVRDPDTIEEELKNIELNIYSITGEIKNLTAKIEEWEKEHKSHDQVMDGLVDLRGEARDIEKQLAELAPLPEGFENPQKFMDTLKKLRDRSRQLEEEIYKLKIELNNAKMKLPEESTEEIQERLKHSQRELEKLVSRAQAICIIEEEHHKLVEEMDTKTFDPLISSFKKYLSPVTNYRYSSVTMNGPIPDSIAREEGREMPVDLLSTGTTRGLALALRLAMAEHLLKDTRGFLVMDDPLVDLDPERKEQAAGILKAFSQDKQLLITTCDPVTAELLGEGIIQL